MTVLAAGATSVWLIACAWQDVHTRSVSNWLTVVPLTGAVLWRLAAGDWAISALLAALIAASELPRAWRWVAAAAALATLAPTIFGEHLTGVLLGVAGAWIGWALGAFGAADAKLLMTLALLFPSPILLVSIALANGALGICGLLAKKQRLPMALAIAAGTGMYFGLNSFASNV